MLKMMIGAMIALGSAGIYAQDRASKSVPAEEETRQKMEEVPSTFEERQKEEEAWYSGDQVAPEGSQEGMERTRELQEDREESGVKQDDQIHQDPQIENSDNL